MNNNNELTNLTEDLKASNETHKKDSKTSTKIEDSPVQPVFPIIPVISSSETVDDDVSLLPVLDLGDFDAGTVSIKDYWLTDKTDGIVYAEPIEFYKGLKLLVGFKQEEGVKTLHCLRFVPERGITNTELFELASEILEVLKNPTKKGFVLPSEINFSNLRTFDVLSKLLIANESSENESKDESKEDKKDKKVDKKVDNKVANQASGIKRKRGRPRKESQLTVKVEEEEEEETPPVGSDADFPEHYKWMYNLILLNLYTMLIKYMSLEELDLKLEQVDDDFLIDYKLLIGKIHSLLDPSIKLKLNKKGINVIQNIYAGFDTEYKQNAEKWSLNDLISVQIALNTRTYLKLPLLKQYFTCSVSALSKIKYKTPKSMGFRYDIFEENVNQCIREVRYLRFRGNDFVLSTLVNGFKHFQKQNPDKFEYFEKDDDFVVSLPRSHVEKYVYLNEKGTGYTFANLVKKSQELGLPLLNEDFDRVRNLLKELTRLIKIKADVVYKEEEEEDKLNKADFDFNKSEELLNFINNKVGVTTVENGIIISDDSNVKTLLDSKRYTRSKMRSIDVNLNRVRSLYVISHLSNADLSMLSDFEMLKENLDIVNRSFVTLGRPLVMEKINVVIRDTILLAPAGKKSLYNLGDLLGIKKVELSKGDIENMDKLLRLDRKKFLDYAITDSIITLKYANYIEDQAFKFRYLGIPISLSSFAANYVKNSWDSSGYKGYQIDNEYLIGDSGVTQTPKGLFVTGRVGLKVGLFVANYKGGRNESFMYGIDNDRQWFDYDLTAAYPTGMTLLGDPDYEKSKILTEKELFEKTPEELVQNYLILRADFEFPKSVKYPSIPCYIDETTTIYPLKGKSVLTGIEFLLAREQGCKFTNIEDIFLIPFARRLVMKENGEFEEVLRQQPFRDIIITLQGERSKHPKNTLGNLMEKEKANSIYGNVVRGMSNKKKFDIKSGRTIRMEGSSLSNPIIASWITAFVRSVIGECLHNIQELGGFAVSVTTDGFLTNVSDLESRIVSDERLKNSCYILKLYLATRKEIVKVEKLNSPDSKISEGGLELKTSGVGILSWTTRGQFSLDGRILAATGFQAKGLDREFLNVTFRNVLSDESKLIEYIQTSLRSAKDLYLNGGHVTKTFSDRSFRMEYDNKRVLIIPENLKNLNDLSNTLLDSSPVEVPKVALNLRFLSKLHKTRVYNRYTTKAGTSVYKSFKELAVRNFIKISLTNPIDFNLTPFENYSSLIEFIKGYDPMYRVTKSSLSHLKNRKLILKSVPKTNETLAFIAYVLVKFPDFKVNDFFK